MDAGCCFVKSESSSASLSLSSLHHRPLLSLALLSNSETCIHRGIHSHSMPFRVYLFYQSPDLLFSVPSSRLHHSLSRGSSVLLRSLSLSSSRLSLPLSPSFLVSVLSGVKPTFSQRDSVVPASAAVQGRRQRELESSRGSSSSRRAAVVVVKKRRSVGEKREREARVGQQKCTRVCVHHVNWLPDWMMQASCSGLSGAAPVQLQIQRDRTDKRVNERV